MSAFEGIEFIAPISVVANAPIAYENEVFPHVSCKIDNKLFCVTS
jgi:hypothetical protein